MAEDEKPADPKPSVPTSKRPPAATIDVAATEIAPSASADEASSAGEPPHQAEPARRSPSIFATLFAALIGGAVVAAAGAGILWYRGIVPGHDATRDDFAARLAKLEAQPPAATLAADRGALDEIAARIAKLETAMTATAGNAMPEARVSTLETNIKGMGDAVSGLASRGDELRAQLDAVHKALAEIRSGVAQQQSAAPDNADLEKIAGRIAPLEAQLQKVQQAIGARSEPVPDRDVRHAFVASSLREHVLRGTPFAAELAAFKSLGGDSPAIAVLEPFAAQGVPSAAGLSAEVAATLRKIVPKPETPQPSGFLERLQANAERLVRIRPVGEVAGADAGAVIARAEARAARADVDGVLTELAQLTPQERAPAEAWIAKAKARQAAIAAAGEIAAKSVGVLAPAARQ